MCIEAVVRGRSTGARNWVALATLMLLLGAESAAAVSYDTQHTWILTPSGFTDSWAYDIVSTPSGPKEIGYGKNSFVQEHALLWNGSTGYTDLYNAGVTGLSRAYGISATNQVGISVQVYSAGEPSYFHALRWQGTAASAVDIHPSGYDDHSWAWDTTENQAVGYVGGGQGGGPTHAYLWNLAGGGGELHPPLGFTESMTYGTNDAHQVGYGSGPQTGNQRHALLWSGTANSWGDLHPASDYAASEALAISGSQQVGFGTYSNGQPHALLWQGTAQTYADLHPTGLSPSGFPDLNFYRSWAYGTNGTQQVGSGTFINYGWNHAILWSGTASSAVDLHQFLPAPSSQSWARAIDSQGNIVGYAMDSSGHTHGVLWQAIPEPSTLLLLLEALLCLLGYAWRRRA